MACLGWLVPGLPPPGTQILLLPPHTLRSILSSEKLITHNKHTCIHKPHTNHAISPFNQRVSETNMFRLYDKKLFNIRIITLIIAR
jgi:hypothetical protein